MLSSLSGFVIMGAILFVPLLVACIGAGAVWAWLLRKVVAASGGMPMTLPVRPMPGRLMTVILFLLGSLWILAMIALGGLLFGGPALD